MKAILASAQARAKPGFSERKPYPGWMASARLVRAAAMTFSMTR